MADKKSSPRSNKPADSFDQARNELFSHILRCGVLKAAVDHQKEWFDDTMEYLADRYVYLTDKELGKLRHLGEMYCRPVINRSSDDETTSEPATNGASDDKTSTEPVISGASDDETSTEPVISDTSDDETSTESETVGATRT